MKQQRPKRGRSSEKVTNLVLTATKTTSRAKHQESQCKVCSSTNRLIIERKYLDGYSERVLAQLYSMSDSAIHRHVVGTDLNRLRQTDSEIYYRRVMLAAQEKLGRAVTIRDGLRAAERLDKICGLEKEPRQMKDTERRQVLLDERIEFALDGFRRGGVQLTRRDILEMFSKTPESFGELYPLVLNELARTRTKAPLIEPQPKEGDVPESAGDLHPLITDERDRTGRKVPLIKPAPKRDESPRWLSGDDLPDEWDEFH